MNYGFTILLMKKMLIRNAFLVPIKEKARQLATLPSAHARYNRHYGA